jgi:hypothetical protein
MPLPTQKVCWLTIRRFILDAQPICFRAFQGGRYISSWDPNTERFPGFQTPGTQLAAGFQTPKVSRHPGSSLPPVSRGFQTPIIQLAAGTRPRQRLGRSTDGRSQLARIQRVAGLHSLHRVGVWNAARGCLESPQGHFDHECDSAKCRACQLDCPEFRLQDACIGARQLSASNKSPSAPRSPKNK